MKMRINETNRSNIVARAVAVALIIIATSALTQDARARLIREIQVVDYRTGALGDSGVGDWEGWVMVGGGPYLTVTNGSASLDGTLLGLVASQGDRIFIPAVTNWGTRNQFVPNGTFPQTNPTNIYYSFLYKFNNIADIHDGEVLMRVNRANSGMTTPQHWDLLARRAGSYIQLGISKPGTGNATNWATTNISIGETIFVVVKQEIIPGAQNDVYSLWINPPEQYFGTNEDNLPPASAVVGQNPQDGTEDSSATGPGRWGFACGANAEIDEIRIGTFWAEVTPPVEQCISAQIVSSPTNITVPAGISAIFRVEALGTGLTYQWQLSTNNGVTWAHIPDATRYRYVTPNLQMADNGTQYRCIVRVACDNSAATSAVATVTVYAPVETPAGLVLHDLFQDGLRDNEPVAISNSVWRASTSASFESYPGPGVIATPVAGSSSLWVGYFTPSNQPPVHLAIGRQIKVTFPFRPESFNSFTNAGNIRFGLFDYYDGGVRLAGDGFTGSAGNGTGVRGYMLSLNFGTNFTDGTPLDLYVRTALDSANLIGAASDFTPIGSGPAGGGYSNAPAFRAGELYTLEFSVLRYDLNGVRITVGISGGGTNWMYSADETTYAVHRFDAFAVRPVMLEQTADQFYIPEFKVEVVNVPIVTNVAPFRITQAQFVSPSALALTWESVPGVVYNVLSRSSLTSGTWVTNATVTARASLTSVTNQITGDQTYFKIEVPLPQLPPP